jgi:hypothetical protein
MDGVEKLLAPISELMNLICNQRTVPVQWLASKTIPVYKNKRSLRNIEN